MHWVKFLNPYLSSRDMILLCKINISTELLKLLNRLKFLHKWLIMFSSKLCHTEDGSHIKCPVKTYGVSDGLSGDMLAAELA